MILPRDIHNVVWLRCVTPDVDSSLVVNGVSSDIGKLNDLIQLFIDEEIQVSKNSIRSTC